MCTLSFIALNKVILVKSMLEPVPEGVLTWSVADHADAKGPFRFRFQGLVDDVDLASEAGVWQYFRTHRSGIARQIEVQDEHGRIFTGLNGASQDYLGLAGDTRVIDASKAAVDLYGAHSAGSAPMGGRTSLATRVEHRVSDAIGLRHVCLFPTGWAAGYGALYALLRKGDHVVIDMLAHNCLRHGAEASGATVHNFGHNDLNSLEKRLRRIRSKEPDAEILIVTEGLFSMDSDSPDISRLVELKKLHGAALFLDVAHDFGVLGPGGAGVAAEAGGYGEIDFVMGSFSKTFASIGGFFAAHDLGSVRAVQGFSGSYTFSNYLIPAQLGALDAAFDIVFSREGEDRRARLLENTCSLRSLLKDLGVETIGDISAMTIVKAGSEARARLAYRSILAQGVIVNCVEYPAVRRGEARFRVQLSPDYHRGEIEAIAAAIASGLAVADGPLVELPRQIDTSHLPTERLRQPVGRDAHDASAS